MKILLVMSALSWLVGLVSLFAVGGIETAALWQPDVAFGQYQHPHIIKCGLRFFTDAQEKIYSIAYPLFICSLIVFAVVGFAYNRIQGRRVEERENAHLDQFSLERAEQSLKQNAQG